MARLRQIMDWVKQHPLPMALILGLVLRLIGIQSRSLQYDDTFSIFLASRSLAEIIPGTAADTMPPLYYFLLHYWMLVGQSVWFIRLLSVLLSLVAVALLYALVERWFGRAVAAWAALLAAISPLLIYHGQDVRMYALLAVAQLGYLLFFTRIWFDSKENAARRLDWLGLILCGAAAMYSHNVAVFVLVVPSAFLLVRRAWKLLFRLAAAQMCIGLLALPWLLLIPGQIAKVQKAWTLPQPGLVEVLQALMMFTASLPQPLPLLSLVLLLSLQILAILILELWRSRRDLPGAGFWVALLLIPPGLLFIASYLMKPIFIPRAFLVSSLAFDALAALIIVRTWSRGAGKLLLGAFLLAAAISLPTHYTYDAFPRSPYQQATAYLSSTAAPGARIIHDNKLSFFPARFYAPALAQSFLADPAGAANDTFEPLSQQAMQIFPEADLDTAVGDSSDVYFITYSKTLEEYQLLGMPEHPKIRWLEERFQRVNRVVFNDLEIYHYER